MVVFGLIFLSLSSTLLLHVNLSTAQTFVYNFCKEGFSPNSTYRAQSKFEANRNLLLSSISNNTVSKDSRFYTETVGRDADRVSGIFQCRGDIATEDCKKCADTAIRDIKLSRCLYQKDVSLIYDECLLRVSNKTIISIMTDEPKYDFNWGQNVTDPDRFTPKLNELLGALVDRAVNSTDMFAIGENNVTNSQTIYGLVQCTTDISRSDCKKGLTKSISEIPLCCDGKDGVRVLRTSCILWFEIYNFFESNAVPVIISPWNTDIPTEDGKSSRTALIIVVITVTLVVFLSIVAIFIYLRRNRGLGIADDGERISTVESLQFNFVTVMTATDNFSDANKLGEGGFGAVYKGILKDGHQDRRQIAVKRLSINSAQGVQEFMNEVLLLAKVQHRNLVRLLGFCLEGDEKILIYEYVQNASLDHFIFDPIKRTLLDWERRYNIIGGIARGLLYLHEDSQHRIVHRDLKASNILLDEKMNPKISDFGMARLFLVDQTEGNTSKIVGTYGYMAPEYAMHGHFSVKSDVFSFGVLLLEIITGQGNNSFRGGENSPDLLSYAWRQWDEGTALELLDPTLTERYSRNEVMRCIQMALLCVHEDVSKRPTMASVVLMLDSYSVTLPLPSAPALLVNAERNSM